MEEHYKELCNKMMLPDSESLMQIWKMLCSPEEAELALLLPAFAEELAEKTGKDVNRINDIMKSLFLKGVIFKSKRDEKTRYKLAKNLTQFHDATIVWEDAGETLYELWKKVLDEDMTALIKSLPEEFSMPTSLRVIPVDKTIEPGSSVLVHEECVNIIDAAENIAVVKCPCRLSQKNCDAPLEACIQINRGADYALDRGHGRKVSRQEAIEILKDSARAGLVHVVENKEDTTFICNCCECCCESLRVLKSTGKKWILSPSRYLAVVNEEECTSCGECAGMCPFDAITIESIAVVDKNECLGCGVCAVNCPSGAITLKQLRPEEHIPVTK